MVSENDFNEYCISKIENWFKFFKSKDYTACNEITTVHVNLCKQILDEEQFGDSEEANNLAYITGVLFKGFSEYVQLAEFTRNSGWAADNKKTEEIWNLMWNCYDRFKFCKGKFFAEDFDKMLVTLDKLKENFIGNFGHGLYSSPEILIKKEICSICEQDSRACLHFTGQLYNGVMCYSVAQKFDLKSVSLVTVPRDPRCRMWLWNLKEDNTISGAIMVLFRIDDWLNENGN